MQDKVNKRPTTQSLAVFRHTSAFLKQTWTGNDITSMDFPGN